MKLKIKRNQSKKLMGGIAFELEAKADLNEHEMDLVKKYRVDKEVLMKKEINIPLTNKVYIMDITIGSLINGQTFKGDNIAEILEYENNVIEACNTFKSYIQAMEQFGGEEVIEI